MKTVLLTAALTILPLTAFAHGPSGAMTTSKIAELTAHRIDRLVATKKIDASFATRLERVEVMPMSGPFHVIVSQTKPTNGLPLQVELLFDATGNPTSFKVVAGGVAGPDPKWAPKNAVSLLELSMHQLLDHATEPAMDPFANGLTTVTLTAMKANGMDESLAQIASDDTTNKLNIVLMTDGTYMSSEIVQ